MKKIISLLLLSALVLLACIGCSAPNDNANNNNASENNDSVVQIKVGFMNGPTGMGMAKLIADNGGLAGNDKYAFTKYTDTSLAAADLLAGKIDVVCLPTNEAAKNYNTTNTNSQVIAINCLNSLFILSGNDAQTITSFSDLDGKTIHTCQKGTPAIILKKLIAEYGINATVSHEYTNKAGDTVVIDKPADIPPAIISGAVDYVLAPEPIVTTALSKITSNPNVSYTVDLDLADAWNDKFDTEIAMGCIVANKNFVSKNSNSINKFKAEYKNSIDYMNKSENADQAAEYLVQTTISDTVENAKSALTNLGENIAFIDNEEMKTTLVGIYNIFGMNVIGGALPDDDFYYAD